MLSTLVVAALLSLSDPIGDATGNGTLSTPGATLMRQREAFDIVSVSVPDRETFGLSIGLGRVSSTFPQALLEFYLTDTDSPPGTGTAALLRGSSMRLPAGQGWSYAVRIVGNTVELFDGRSGNPTNVADLSSARLRASGNTLTLQTRLPLPQHFSLYGMSGSYDPFSQTGWRQLREQTSPWGYAGEQTHPVLDVVADSAEVQTQALSQGVLPEVRGSFSEGSWLLVAGAGVVLAIGGLVARIALGRRRRPMSAPPGSLPPIVVPLPETALSPFDAGGRLMVLAALARGEARLIVKEVEHVPAPEPDP